MSGINTKVVGYQHAALFKFQHAVYRSLGKNLDPTLVLCAGQVGLGQMLRHSNLQAEIVGVLGSPRVHANITEQAHIGNKKILVIPEGILDDCIDLFCFSIECAKLDPSIEFIWRLHPLMSFEKIFATKNELSNRPSNITISTHSFEFDIAQTSFALYKGSTAVISAAAAGLIPIYLNRLNNFSVNPLFEIDEKCIRVSTPKELVYAIAHSRIDPSVIEYCTQFYQPLNSNSLRNLLND